MTSTSALTANLLETEAFARYALEGLPNKVMAAEYRVVLPKEKLLVAEIEKTRHLLETQRIIKAK